MAEGQILTTQELVRKALADEHGDFLKDAVAMVAAQMMEAEISAQIGAERGEVAPAARVTHRNGTGRGCGRRASVRSSWRFRASARGRRTSRASWSRGGAPSRRSSRS